MKEEAKTKRYGLEAISSITRNGAAEAHAYPHAAWLVMGPCIVEIDLNRCRNEEIIVKRQIWVGLAPQVEIDRIVIREVQYQFEVNGCRNEEIVVKGNFVWAWPMWAGRPRIDCIVIREVQYQFEVNPCRNEEIIVIGNFGWVWPMLAGRPRIDRIVIREVQYQFEDNRCRNEEIIIQGSSADSVGEDSGQDGWTDRQRRLPQYPHAFQKA
ncbi:hypothetical protein DPMN_007375 [Dreissena polymorpha]|uniref:Uncharacterized protein n=1 Tax=Dreissena polymorpha TaxID=45954 RepID=A0A9D4MWE7_DREPO|nr:hypothetical protein DPMN_007375 [Dreissena polymorpha]